MVVLAAICISAGCSTDIVTTGLLRDLEAKCIHVEVIESEDQYVGRVIRDVLEKELIRKRVAICDAQTANVFVSGSTFMTLRAPTKGSKRVANQAIESVSVVAKDRDGQVLLTASYDNKDQRSASNLAREFGAALAGKLK
jgi:hypothetical protein